MNQFPDSIVMAMSTFCDFQPVTLQELSDIINDIKVKSCLLDPFPVTVFKRCQDTLLPILKRIVNFSLTQGIMPKCMKVAVLVPLLKHSSLDTELLSDYWPISNLTFTSKLCEKLVAVQVIKYVRIVYSF